MKQQQLKHRKLYSIVHELRISDNNLINQRKKQTRIVDSFRVHLVSNQVELKYWLIGKDRWMNEWTRNWRLTKLTISNQSIGMTMFENFFPTLSMLLTSRIAILIWNLTLNSNGSPEVCGETERSVVEDFKKCVQIIIILSIVSYLTKLIMFCFEMIECNLVKGE